MRRPLGEISWVAVCGIAAVLIGGLSTGIYATAELADPGAVTRFLLPLITLLRDGISALTIGAFGLAACIYSPTLAKRPRGELTYDAPEWAAAMKLARTCAIIWPLAEVALLIVTYSSVAAVPMSDPGFGPGITQFITSIELGQIMAWSVIFTVILSIVAAFTHTLAGAAWGVGLSLLSLIPLALTGHAAGAADHTLAVSAMFLHIVAVGAWAGGLVALVATSPRSGSRAAAYAQRYSKVAAWALFVTVYSGIAAAWIRFNNLGEFFTTPYGRLLLAKIVLTGILALIGLEHRRRRIPEIREKPAGFFKLAAGEGLLMGAVMGAAAALGESAPPVPQTPLVDASPTYMLSQYPVPPYPELFRYVTEWRLEPMLAFLSVSGIVMYLIWVRRLNERGDAWPALRTVSWVTGLVIFIWVTCGGPTVYGTVLFSAHMFMHMMLAMVVPIFLALGAPVTLLARAVPARTDGSRSGREILLHVARSRYGAFWAHPVIAGINFAGSLILFYFTGLFHLALTTHMGHLAMIVHFTLAGYMFVNALIGIDPGPSRPPWALRLVLLFATMGFHAFFGIAVISSTNLLANEFFGWLGLPWVVDAHADQVIGGAITWGIGEFPTLALAVAVGVSWSFADARTAKRLDRKADRDHDAELKAYNEMLASRVRN